MCKIELTPPKAVGESTEERNMGVKTLQLTWAAVTSGILKKTTSLPDLVPNVNLNALYKPIKREAEKKVHVPLYRSCSVGDEPSIDSDSIDFTEWSTDDFSIKHDVNGGGHFVCGMEDTCIDGNFN